MKIFTRLLIALLIAALMLPLAMACAETTDPEETTVDDPAQTSTPGGPVIEETTIFAPSDIPEDLQFPDTTIKFLYWKDVERPEFFVEDTNGEAVNDAIYERNLKVQDQFKITLQFDGTPGNFNNQQAFVNTCINSTQSGADAHDIFAGYSMTGASLALKGIAQDLTSYDIIEFDKPWWPNSLVEKATLRDKIYFCSGDISTNFLYMMYGCFFHKEMFTEIHGNPSLLYEEVYNNTWTLDKLMTYSQGVYKDLNGDGAKDIADRYGFFTISLHYDSIYAGSGLKTVEVNGEGDLVLSEDLYSQKTSDLLTNFCNFVHNSEDAFHNGSGNAQAFRDETVLFTVDRVYIASGTLKQVEFKFGMLPIPMYNEDQENYVTCMAFPFTMYALSTASPNPEAAAATLELMAYQSYLKITPALFEESMKLRYSDEGEDSIMYDIIRECVYIDVGRIFTTHVNNLSYSLVRNCIASNGAGSWMSSKTAQSTVFRKHIRLINEGLDALN